MKKIIILTVLSISLYTAVFSQTGRSVQPVQSYSTHYNVTESPLKLEFHQQKGDKFRILSTVTEDVYVNRQFNHRGLIINRVSVNVPEVNRDGSAVLEAKFMTTEESESNTKTIKWAEEYYSKYTRSKTGVYSGGDEYFMPTVRNVPVFPDKEIKPGDKWTAEGYEVHDLRQTFNITEPYKIPFTAEYEYLGTVVQTKKLYVIKVVYSLYYESPVEPKAAGAADWPQMTMGHSNQLIYWDAEKGCIDHYQETFRILIETAYGNIMEFRGNAEAEITDFVSVKNENTVEKIQEEVNRLGVKNVTVNKNEKGLTLSIENIKFMADSAILEESEKKKLMSLAEILKQYPDNDILVSGHTALAGTEGARQKLSEDRAETVAAYLIELGVKDKYHIFTEGYGATKPIAPNTTEAGKAKNRRVEITILE